LMSGSNVRVAVRIRPLLSNEIEAGHMQSILQVNDDDSVIEINQKDAKNTTKNFKFDKIIDQKFSQQQVFEMLQI